MSTLITVTVVVRAPLALVWERLADLASHPHWMTDAVSLEFLGSQTSGVGTRMEVDTRVGPLRTTDVLEVIGWDPPRSMEVAHRGSIVGRGRFQLDPIAGGTRLRWIEELSFPWWLGGSVTELLSRPVLFYVWRANLERFRSSAESRLRSL